ncbi:hypothetical protein RUM43_003746 [Polyplax serrata]|uniref:Uncharacterized protein n=1 Tax=Polyplax serrata TaxID=468196 RepID=A0AAN8NXA7_POLSC
MRSLYGKRRKVVGSEKLKVRKAKQTQLPTGKTKRRKDEFEEDEEKDKEEEAKGEEVEEEDNKRDELANIKGPHRAPLCSPHSTPTILVCCHFALSLSYRHVYLHLCFHFH